MMDLALNKFPFKPPLNLKRLGILLKRTNSTEDKNDLTPEETQIKFSCFSKLICIWWKKLTAWKDTHFFKKSILRQLYLNNNK